jgi:hypothetical protein
VGAIHLYAYKSLGLVGIKKIQNGKLKQIKENGKGPL